MGKRNSGLIGERESVNPVLQQKKREKEMQRKRHKDSKSQPSGKGTHSGNGANSADQDVEYRAKAWKEAQFGLSAAPKPRTAQISQTLFLPSSEPVPLGARYSVYFDLVSNPSGRPPAHKPVAYQHEDGVIRPYPPAKSESEYSETSSSEDEEPIPVLPKSLPSVPVFRAPAPLPVKQPPPPRPMGIAPSRPVLLPTLMQPIEEKVHLPEPVREEIIAEPVSIGSSEVVIESFAEPVKYADVKLFLPSSLRRK